MTNAAPHLSPAQVQALGDELDALRQRLLDDLGERDVSYIRKIIRVQRALEVSGRGLMFFSFAPPAWFGGVASLALSKILDNMEIGHNVMHGQYDWTGIPELSGHEFEWDNACPGSQWRHSHNYMHHTYTNIHGKDRDLGYTLLRISPDQRWEPSHLLNPLNAFMLAVLFQYGVALHDVETESLMSGKATMEEKGPKLAEVWQKVRRQTIKDYVLFPALAGPNAPLVFAGNASANLIRNIWSFMIIFCGHFPMGVEEFTEEETANETRGEWYLRQMLGSANISGGKLFHILSGNLSHQIEHHIFPDVPAHRYAEVAVEVREICERYGLAYTTGPLSKQFGSVVGKIVRLAFPGGARPKAPPRPALRVVPPPSGVSAVPPRVEAESPASTAAAVG